MVFSEKDVKRFSAIALIILIVFLAFLIIKPILISIIGGLLLAYVFYPVFKLNYKLFREKNTAAFAVVVLIVLVIFIPLWFLLPMVIRQLFDVFSYIRILDVASFVKTILPNFSPKIQVDITASLTSLVGKISTASLGSLTEILLNLPKVLLQFVVIVFVFFFGMRDADKLKAYVAELSPLKREKGSLLAKQFKQITNSIIYGNFIIGIVQGILTGIGLLIFGVPKALLLTLLAVFAAVIPVVGVWLVWIPAAVYLFSIGNVTAAIIFAAYCLLVVSTIDNFLRPYLVARKTKSSSVIVLIGMIGGLIVFGFLGLIIGPLILEYVVLFLDAYKSKTLADMFRSD